MLEGLCSSAVGDFIVSTTAILLCLTFKTMTGLLHLIKKCLMLNYLQVVKPLLQERTRKKIQVLQGCGRDELLKVSMFSHSNNGISC